MKFIVILKDSFREAVDAKVMYVMVALSAVLVLLLLSLSFQPTSGKSLMEMLTLSLNAAMYESEGGDRTGRRRPINVAEGKPILYLMESYATKDGGPDSPHSQFRVTIDARCADKVSAEKLREAPAATIDFMRKHFGASLGGERDFHVVDVTDVQLVPAGTEGPRDPSTVAFVLEAKPTEAAMRLWPHEMTMFFGLVPLRFKEPLPLGLSVFVIQDIIVNTVGAWVAAPAERHRNGLLHPQHDAQRDRRSASGQADEPRFSAALQIPGWPRFHLPQRRGRHRRRVVGSRSSDRHLAPTFLLYILVLTFFFAILYSASTLFSVLTQSPVVVILLTIMVWVGLSVVGKAYTEFENTRIEEERMNIPMADRWESTWYVQAINCGSISSCLVPRTWITSARACWPATS